MYINKSVSKEDFKTYFTKCQKLAWFFSSEKNFLAGIKLKNEKKFDFDTSVDTNKDNFNTSISFDIMSEFEFLFDENTDLDESQIEKLAALKLQFTSEEGFDLEVFKGKQIEDGLQTGVLAQEYFELKLYRENKLNNENKESIDFEAIKMGEELVSKVEEALSNPNIKYLYEPGFYAMNQLVKTRCDILINNGNKHVEIVEVKATSEVKKEHIFDIYYQKQVLEMNGYIVDNVYLLRLNKEYFPGTASGYSDYDPKNQTEVKYSDFSDQIEALKKELNVSVAEEVEIEIEKLFVLDDRGVNTVKKELVSLKYSIECLENSLDFQDVINTLSKMLYEEPNFKAKNCFNLSLQTKNNIWVEKHKDCSHVFKFIEEKHNVLTLKSSTKANNMNFINITGITDLKDIDNEIMEQHKDGFFKTPKIQDQMRVMMPYLKGKEYKVINPNEFYQVEYELKKYENYPVYMYDFETSTWAIPKFSGSSAYQQIPFQYSIDVLIDNKFDVKNENSYVHHEFLSKIKTDPRNEFVKRFIVDSFSNGPGVYVAYNMSFEKSVITKLIHKFPEYTKPLQYIFDNTIDLMYFFNRKLPTKEDTPCLVYHPDFKGSYSIKYTQPALYPDLNYNDLKVNKGDKTSELFRQFIDGSVSQNTYETVLYKDMLIYCNRDTAAMIAVLQSIIELVEKERR